MEPSRKAQFGRDLIKEPVVELLVDRDARMTHAEIVHELDIPSDFEGGNANFLSWSILGLLVKDGSILYEGDRQNRVYFVSDKRPLGG